MFPVVTIGVCVKNNEATIREAITSVLDQDFPHGFMEIVIVDGFSKDKTLEIIRETLSGEDASYRIFFENEGLGRARQIVVEKARGDFIIWVDGDIRLSRSYVRRQVAFMEKNPKVGIAGGKYGVYHGKEIVSILENMQYIVQSFLYGEKELPQTMLWGTEGSIFRVKSARDIGGFDVRIKGAAEDTDFAYRLKEAGWLIFATDAEFHEEYRASWKSFWDQHVWYGRGVHYVHHKHGKLFVLYKILPLAGLLEGLLFFRHAYKITYRKIAVWLPLHFFLKRSAWCFGFIKAHLEGYGHE